MAVAQKRLDRLNTQLTTSQTKQSAIGSLETLFTNLQTKADALRDLASIKGVSASSSDQTVVAVSTSGAASEGIHDIEVNQLAAAETRVHSGLASNSEALGSAARFVYTYNGVTRTIQTSDTTTLADLVDLINDDSSNPGVQASVIRYDSGDGLAYHLVLRGGQTGADHAITVEAATTLAGFDGSEGNWTVSQAARNAEVRIDSYPAGGWIENDTNSIADLIPNVTLELKKTGSVSVSLTRSSSSLQTSLQDFVDAYNTVATAVDTLTGYDSGTETGGAFQGDSTLTGMVTRIREQLVRAASGFDGASASYATPASIGLELDKDGKLSLDTSVLSEAMSDDYEGVLSLITAASAGSVSSSDIQFSSALSSTEPGSYQLKVVYDAGGNVSEAYYRVNDSSDEWRAAVVDGDSITGAEGSPEQGLNILVVNPQLGQTVTYDVQVKQGFAGALYDAASDLLAPSTGTFAVKNDQFDLAQANLKLQIELQETRLEQRRERLTAKYQRMETALAKLDSMKGAFDAVINSVSSYLNGSNS